MHRTVSWNTIDKNNFQIQRLTLISGQKLLSLSSFILTRVIFWFFIYNRVLFIVFHRRPKLISIALSHFHILHFPVQYFYFSQYIVNYNLFTNNEPFRVLVTLQFKIHDGPLMVNRANNVPEYANIDWLEKRYAKWQLLSESTLSKPNLFHLLKFC